MVGQDAASRPPWRIRERVRDWGWPQEPLEPQAPGAGALLCDAYGGAVNRVAPTATAFMHRGPLFCIQYYGDGASTAWVDQAWQKMRPHVTGHAYQNYIDHSLANWQHAYYGQNLARLQATRQRIDPHHYFHFPQAIP